MAISVTALEHWMSHPGFEFVCLKSFILEGYAGNEIVD